MKILSSAVPTGRVATIAAASIVLGALLLTYASPSFGAQNAAGDAVVDIRLVPDRANVNPGEQFNVAIQIEPNGQPVAGFQAFIDFDPSVLQVTGLSLGSASPLSVELLNNFRNTEGEIDFAAGSFTSSPSTTFVAAIITFTAGGADAATTLSFSRELPRQTIVSIGADEVLRDLIDAVIIIGNPLPTPTPSPVPSPSPTPEPTPTPTVTNTPVATPTPSPTPTLISTPVSSPSPTPLPLQVVDIRLVSDADSVVGGERFNISIVVEPNGQEVTGVETFIEFDPGHVTARKVTIDSSSPLNMELSNSISNDAGFVQIGAGVLGSGPISTFTMAVVEFEALSVDATTGFTLANSTDRNSMASVGGFAVQRNLFGTSVTIIKPSPTPVLPQILVDLKLTGPESFVATSSIFDITILVEPNGQEVSGVQVFLNFDPNEVTVDTLDLHRASAIDTLLIKEFDNVSGTVLIAAGTLGLPVTEPFTLAVIGFRAASEPSLTEIRFSIIAPRNTIASVDGVEVQRDTKGIMVQVGPHSDLRITKQGTPRTVRAGDVLTYTLEVMNVGPETAVGVTISDTLAAGMEFVEAIPTQGECSESAGTVVCNLGDLASGGSAKVEIFVTADVSLLGEEIVNEAVVASPRFDPNTSNNSATTTVQIPAISELGLVAMAGAFVTILLVRIVRDAKQG